MWPRKRHLARPLVDVSLSNGPAAATMVQAGQLAPTEGRQHVGESIVVADLSVLVPRTGCLAWVDRYRAWSTSAVSSLRSIPPPDVVITLLPLKESAAACPNLPAGVPPQDAPRDSAASSSR